MTPTAGAGASPNQGGPVYHEPARGYGTAFGLLALLLAGMGIDLGIGGLSAHLIAWLAAIVVVVGTDLFSIRTARRLRSITVTAAEVRVGEAVLARDTIEGLDDGIDPAAPVLGQSMQQGLPPRVPGLGLKLAGGRSVTVPTRYPGRLAEALRLAPGAPRALDIRPARMDEMAGLAEIDARAATLFRVAGVDLPEMPFPADALHEAVAIFVADRPPVGYVRVDEVDGLAHVAGLAVIPGSMRRGVGSALLEAACAWATERGYPAITVITFADVPWNAPFYASCGFTVVPADAITPELAELRDWERAVGLDALGPRVVMRRELRPTSPPRRPAGTITPSAR